MPEEPNPKIPHDEAVLFRAGDGLHPLVQRESGLPHALQSLIAGTSRQCSPTLGHRGVEQSEAIVEVDARTETLYAPADKSCLLRAGRLSREPRSRCRRRPASWRLLGMQDVAVGE